MSAAPGSPSPLPIPTPAAAAASNDPAVRRQLDAARRELLDLGLRNTLLNYRTLRARGLDVVDEDPTQVLRMLAGESRRQMTFLPAPPPNETSDATAAPPDDPTTAITITATTSAQASLLPDTPPQQQRFDATRATGTDTDTDTTETAPTLASTAASAPAAFDPDATTVSFDEQDTTPLPTIVSPSALPQPAAPTRASAADTRLQTPHQSPELQKRLLTTYYAARTVLEEQGVNILYLALGVLRWYEADAAQQPRRAPLYLLPVELERGSALDRFHLRASGDDPGENLSLAEKLRTEFHVDAPPFPDAGPDEFDLNGYFDAWQNAIRGMPRWEIERDVIALGLFSYGRFLMYRDLDSAIWPAADSPAMHPVVAGLLSTDGLRGDPLDLPDDAIVDRHVAPGELAQVVDADSSQTLAMRDIARGRHLVIQGPPGTGKSQTITNVIAQAIGDGRSVLFVAEKMAALEVVKRRLDSVGLGDACLELHSHKISKREVLQELQRTLDLGQPRTRDLEAELAQLTADRDRLNAYCDALNTPVGTSGQRPYDILGRLLELQREPGHTEWPRIELPNAATWDRTGAQQRLAAVQELQARVARMQTATTAGPRSSVPRKHPFWGCHRTTVLPSDIEALPATIVQTQTALAAVQQSAAALAAELGLPVPDTAAQQTRLLGVAAWAATAPDLAPFHIVAPEWGTQADAIRALFAAGQAATEARALVEQQLLPDVWQADLMELRADLLPYRDSWWRSLSGTYRRARRQVAALCRSEVPDDIDTQIAVLDAALEAKHQTDAVQAQEQSALGTAIVRDWQAERTPFADLTARADWLLQLHAALRANQLPPELLTWLARTGAGQSAHIIALQNALARDQAQFAAALQTIAQQLEIDPQQRFGVADLQAVPHSDLAAWMQHLTANAARWPEMAAYVIAVQNCDALGIAPVTHVADEWPDAGQHLHAATELAWLRAVQERALRERPALARFDSATHEQAIVRFRQLDTLVLERNRARLALRHWQEVPRHVAGGQLGVLRREFAKRTRHIPLRRLVEQAGNAMQAIKPVFMMSPMSVATFLPPGALQFDLVIFDEASQVRPAEAFGSLARGTQAVVVGDRRQLPPTAFFEKLADEDPPDEEQLDDASTTAGIGSVLELAEAQGVPTRMLRWHYRSRHESLIAVSNESFYDRQLITFPSPDHARAELGLHFHHLPQATYDRGGTRTNRGEAAAVIDATLAHARTHPHLTLGIAAFSVAQADAIRDELELRRRNDPSAEGFFAAHPHEPFFVKNLENVQGDERDVIFISIGYGRPTDGGPISMAFGPLNGEFGWRRLNVLITRARMRCEVFSGITADDIDLSRVAAHPRGITALKRFLRYAQTGILDLPEASDREAGSPFEEQVAEALTNAGYQVDGQVGSGGFFLDLAIIDPDRPGRYLLGIECDGATYHSARSARDRDRLRQQVLEGLGWQLHRIWSTDWFRTPALELQRVVHAIEAARARGIAITTAAAEAAATAAASSLRASAALSVSANTELDLDLDLNPGDLTSIEVTPQSDAQPTTSHLPTSLFAPSAAPAGAEPADDTATVMDMGTDTVMDTVMETVDDSGTDTGMDTVVDMSTDRDTDATTGTGWLPVAQTSGSVAPTTIERDDLPADATTMETTASVVRSRPYHRSTQRLQLRNRDLHTIPTPELARWAQEVVGRESPVHVDEVYRRIANSAGVQRVGARIREALERAVGRAERDGTLVRRGDILWLPEMARAAANDLFATPVRDRSGLDQHGRDTDMIAPEEWDAAIGHAIEHTFGLRRSDIPVAAARLLGYQRVAEETRRLLDTRISDLLQRAVLREQGSHLVLANPPTSNH